MDVAHQRVIVSGLTCRGRFPRQDLNLRLKLCNSPLGIFGDARLQVRQVGAALMTCLRGVLVESCRW